MITSVSEGANGIMHADIGLESKENSAVRNTTTQKMAENY